MRTSFDPDNLSNCLLVSEAQKDCRVAPDLQLEMALAGRAVPRPVLRSLYPTGCDMNAHKQAKGERRIKKKEKNLNSAKNNFFLPNSLLLFQQFTNYSCILKNANLPEFKVRVLKKK